MAVSFHWMNRRCQLRGTGVNMHAHDQDEWRKPQSRRRFLATVGMGAAGAAFNGRPFPVTSRAATAQDATRDLHLSELFFPPQSAAEFNPWYFRSFLHSPSIYRDLMFTPMAMFHWKSNDWEPLVATNWAFLRSGDQGTREALATPQPRVNGRIPSIFERGADPGADTFGVTLRDGVTWSDGSPLTSRDVVDTFDLLRVIWDVAWNYLAEVSAEDDHTVRFTMKEPSSLIERAVLRKAPMPSSQFGTFANEARALLDQGHSESSKEWSELNERLTIYLDPTTFVAAGPYILDQNTVDQEDFFLVQNPSSFWADRAVFRRVRVSNSDEPGDDTNVVRTDIDYAQRRLSPADQQKALADGFRIARSPTYAGAALTFQFRALPHFSDKRVRQALAHVLDRLAIGTATYGPSGVPVKYMSGMSDNLVPTWLPASDLNRLNRYAPDAEQAVALLEEAGWVRNGTTWSDPDGTRAAYELSFDVELEHERAIAQVIADQLSTFGIDVAVRGMPASDLWSGIRDGTVQMSIERWGSSWNPHPYGAFDWVFIGQNTEIGEGLVAQHDFSLLQQTDAVGEVDLRRLVDASKQGMDIDAQKERVRQLARIFNELLNVIPLYEFHTTTVCLDGARVKAWPPDDDSILRNSAYADSIPALLIYAGELEPVPQG